MATSPAGPPAPKKTNTLLWVLAALGVLCVLFFASVIGAGLFIAHKARQAGLDSQLIRRSPAQAAARMMVAANPDLEFVSSDEGRQEITVRNKKTGKLVTMSFDDARNGKLTVTTEDGTLRIGGDAKVPTWVPDYPGSQPRRAFSSQGKGEESGSFTFQTKDDSDRVLRFYTDQFRVTGLKLNENLPPHMLIAEDPVGRHHASILVGTEGGETSVSVTYSTRQ